MAAVEEVAEDRWYNWRHSTPANIPLLVSNVLYIALCLTSLILTVLVMHEHVDDFTRNHQVEDTNPCGLPTPDGMYLLQGLGALPAAGWDGATLEPDYQSWMQSIDRALCSRSIAGLPIEDKPMQTPDCLQDPVTGRAASFQPSSLFLANVEELLAIGHLMDDTTITPTLQDYKDDAALAAKNLLFESKACAKDFYSDQQFDSYGELKGRVARAYLAAMPAFSRWNKEHEECMVSSIDQRDPFDSNCKNGCYILRELKAAYHDQFSMYRIDDALKVPFVKQVYRLLALSLAGYYDRYHNNGACFRNGQGQTGEKSAIEFCKDSMDDAAGTAGACNAPTESPTGEQGCEMSDAFEYYVRANHAITQAAQCTDSRMMPPPPAPPVVRDELVLSVPVDRIGPQVCATTLEYGLVEQGRLFGLPDVILPFVIDNRVHRSFHFVANAMKTILYENPAKSSKDTGFDKPKVKLELYMAYRLASSSVWAILVANVAGFLMVRALVPMYVHLLKFLDVKSELRVNPDDKTQGYQPIQLRRPKAGGLIYLTVAVAVLLVYWILYLDPATQSHYYVTTNCQVPSGAYVTTWGKRRFDRYGEHLIGIFIILAIAVLLFQQWFGRAMAENAISRTSKREEDKDGKKGMVARVEAVAFFFLGFAFFMQAFFIAQSATSGQKWYECVKADDDQQQVLARVYANDVIMSVWAAFWNAAAVGWYRQQWAVSQLQIAQQSLWMLACILLVWMPVIQAYVFLEREIDNAFENRKGTDDPDRQALFICILIFSTLWTVLLLVRLNYFRKSFPIETAELSPEEIRKAKAKKPRNGRRGAMANIYAKPEQGVAKSELNLSSVRVLQGEHKSVYMPLLPRYL